MAQFAIVEQKPTKHNCADAVFDDAASTSVDGINVDRSIDVCSNANIADAIKVSSHRFVCFLQLIRSICSYVNTSGQISEYLDSINYNSDYDYDSSCIIRDYLKSIYSNSNNSDEVCKCLNSICIKNFNHEIKNGLCKDCNNIEKYAIFALNRVEKFMILNDDIKQLSINDNPYYIDYLYALITVYNVLPHSERVEHIYKSTETVRIYIENRRISDIYIHREKMVSSIELHENRVIEYKKTNTFLQFVFLMINYTRSYNENGIKYPLKEAVMYERSDYDHIHGINRIAQERWAYSKYNV